MENLGCPMTKCDGANGHIGDFQACSDPWWKVLQYCSHLWSTQKYMCQDLSVSYTSGNLGQTKQFLKKYPYMICRLDKKWWHKMCSNRNRLELREHLMLMVSRKETQKWNLRKCWPVPGSGWCWVVLPESFMMPMTKKPSLPLTVWALLLYLLHKGFWMKRTLDIHSFFPFPLAGWEPHVDTLPFNLQTYRLGLH